MLTKSIHTLVNYIVKSIRGMLQSVASMLRRAAVKSKGTTDGYRAGFTVNRL